MLNKRFKIAKCKTSLKLATSRIKLMRNKKGVQINQMKKELSQLLESGEDRTARIRVEHVIREEKMVAAYDLIGIYCELIVARLPIIESQKTCPMDLKEAVTSVIFAGPRCSDIPELADARKNFTAKYGKEFVSAAIELRPDCGVNHMLIEKLSAVAPDVQTKVKVLTAVAKEYNINWDPTIFEDKPPDDLLNGPTNLSTINPDSSKIQTPNVRNHVENVPVDFSQQNRRFTQNVTTADDMWSSGMSSGKMNTSQSFDNWNMEFKDATDAAQAAAESAERASFAARAAAQLSSQGKISRQFSNDSYTKHEQNPQTSKSREYSYGVDTRGSSKRLSSSSSRNESVNENSVNHLHHKHGQGPSRETSLKNEPADRFNNFKDKVIEKQPSINSSRSHSSTVDQGHRFRGSTKTNLKDDSRKDDETDSDDDDDDDRVFDSGFGYDEYEIAKSFFPSPGRETIQPVENPAIWSPKNVDSPKSVHLSVKSHLSDGPDSESESETSFSGAKKFTSRRKHDTFSKKSSPEVNSTKSRIELSDLVERGSSFDKTNDNKSDDDLDIGKDLSFGTLAGGLGNKKSNNERPVKVEPTSKQTSFSSRSRASEDKKPSVFASSSDSDSEYYSKKKLPKSRPPPNSFFTSNETESEEEETAAVPKRTSSSKVNVVSSGMSFRTKTAQAIPEPTTPAKTPKPSHVHPKLPEYDSLAARIQALQLNRQ